MRVNPRENGRESASSLLASGSVVTKAQAVTVVRRLGYVGLKAHEALMNSLTRQGDTALAEAFNDAFKPVVDMLLHFDVEWFDDTEVEP